MDEALVLACKLVVVAVALFRWIFYGCCLDSSDTGVQCRIQSGLINLPTRA